MGSTGGGTIWAKWETLGETLTLPFSGPHIGGMESGLHGIVTRGYRLESSGGSRALGWRLDVVAINWTTLFINVRS